MDVKVVTSDILRLNVSSSIASLGACNVRKFSKSLTVEDLKAVDRGNVRNLGVYDDVSKIEKYELSNESYDKKTDTVRAFLKKRKLGKYNPEEQVKMMEMEEEKRKMDDTAMDNIQVGSRCQVEVPNNMTRRGTVRYVGFADFKPNVWVGVEYDEPYGKNNGTVNGREYFSCPDKYGGFVRPIYVKCGDYPPIDDFEDEM